MKMRGIVVLFAIGLSTAAPAVAQPAPPEAALEGLAPEPNGLTSSEVARRALAASANLKQKRAELVTADEKITQTMIQFFPRLTLTAGYTRLSPVAAAFGSGALVGAGAAGPLSTGPCPGGAGNCVLDSAGNPVGAAAFSIEQVNDSFSLGARLGVPLSDYVLRLSDAAASSKASREAARIAVEAERLKVAADARVLYFNWLRSRAALAIAQKAVVRTRARLEDARAAFTAGTISKAELLRIEALVANTELVVARAESMVALTAGHLAIVMEDARGGFYRIGEGVPDQPVLPEERERVDRLIAEAHSRRLEMHAADETVRALRRGADATHSGALPRLEAMGDVTYANPNPRYFPPQRTWNGTWSVGVQASWTVGDAFLNAAAGRELEANARVAESRRIALRAGIAQEVLSSYLDLARSRVTLEKQRVALAAAEEAYRVTADLFRAGRATGADVIDAETELLDAKIADVNARIDGTVAAIALRHASGRDVPGATTQTAR